MTVDGSRVTPAWLALRGPADARARDARLAADLGGFLRGRGFGPHLPRPARLIDVGAGTGAGAAWLRRRLPMPQQWRLLDRDAALLASAAPVVAGWAEPVGTDLNRLGEVLHDRPADVIACQALLDLLVRDEIAGLLDPATGSRAAVLLALSVTGEVRLTPGHPDDTMVADAFNAHQRRDGRLGPTAWRVAGEVLREAGYAVTSARTPWHLDARDAGLLDAWLAGRAAAAAEQVPRQAARIADWLADRRAVAGRLSAVVDHVDLLGLPPATAI